MANCPHNKEENGHGILNNRFDDHKKMIILLYIHFIHFIRGERKNRGKTAIILKCYHIKTVENVKKEEYKMNGRKTVTN